VGRLPGAGRILVFVSIDVTDESFAVDVMERSMQVSVVVDLWAEWCGPCKTLGPILEKVIGETNGAVVLAKVDTDANPQIAQAFKVQSIPAVHALRDGKIVASFVGAQPEREVRAFVEALLPTPEQTELERLVEAGDEASLRAVLAEEPDHAEAVVLLAELLAGSERGEDALDLLARIPETPATRRVAALARQGGTVDDVDARLDALLDRVKDDDAARQEYIDLLELLGPDDPRTAPRRKALTSRLF